MPEIKVDPLETIAYNLGKEFARTHDYIESPLSYEYSDMITQGTIYDQVEAIHGPIPEPLYEYVLDDWEQGYHDWWESVFIDSGLKPKINYTTV